MQVRCGQCGRQLRLDDAPDERTILCEQCGHVLSIEQLRPSAGAEAPVRPNFSDDDEIDFAEQARLSLRKKIRIVCGKCGRGLKVETQFAGKGVRCPACGERIRIPFPDEEMEFELANLQATADEELEVLSEEVQRRAVESAEREEDQAEREVEMLLARQRRARRMWITVIAVVVIGWLGALGVWLGYRYYRADADKPDKTGVHSAPAGNGRERPRPATRPITTVPVAPTRPAVERNDFAVLGTELGSFAGRGLFPARPAWRFLRIEVRIEAHGKPLLIRARGKDVTLRIGEKIFESLGLPLDEGSLLPGRGLDGAVRAEPGRPAVVTFLFEVPDSTLSGVLRIGGAGETPVGPFPSPPDQPGLATGTYVQADPRNLKPLMRNPVMAAVQAAPLRHRLSVEDRDGRLVVSIPAAGVSGVAKPGEHNLYQLLLRRGQHTLRCKLRLAEDGRRIILYFADEPFHQLIYTPAKEW